MDNIINWLTGGVELLPELTVIIKLALLFYSYRLVLDLMQIFSKGGRRL